ELLALQVGELLVGTVFFDDDDEVVTLEAIGIAFDGKGYRAGQVDGEVGGTGGKAAHMQPVRAHGFDFGGIALDLVEDDLAVDAFGQILGKGREDLGIDGRVFDGCIGEHHRGRRLELV